MARRVVVLALALVAWSAAPAGAAALPSGRTSYRTLDDYRADLARIVAAGPGLVRPVVLGASVQGRPIEGIEIAEDVGRDDDGRPADLLVGLHHAREWPSGEVLVEHALDLLARRGSDARVDRVLRDVRTVVVPVLNPDGLVASQAGGLDVPDPGGLMAASGLGAYRRKNCAGGSGGACGPGVDLNRNYGAFWGGSGASADPASQTYRGPGPFSEPETQALRAFSSVRQVVVVNAIHTYGATVLHQPGFAEDQPGFPTGSVIPGIDRMRALARAMARAAGYTAAPATTLGSTTGAAEDWSTFAHSAFGYTTEVGHEGFHPDYQDAVVDQFTGLREAFLLQGEAAADAANHAVLRGRARPGTVLRLTKDFRTATAAADGRRLPEHLETSLRVPAGGRFSWHVNPSTRPVAAVAGRTEAWTLSCRGDARRVVARRGRTTTVRLPCGARLRVVRARRDGAVLRVRLRTSSAALAAFRATLRDAAGRRLATVRRARPPRRIALPTAAPGRLVLDVRATTPWGARVGDRVRRP